jgi:hypothetical protein
MSDFENQTPPPGGGATPPPPAGSPPPPPAGAAPPPPGGFGSPPGAPSNPIPWENRDQLGFVQALVENVKLFTVNPKEAFARTREQGDYASPILYVVILSVVVGIINWIWSLVFTAPMGTFLPPEAQEQFGWMMTMMAGGGIINVILAPIMALIGLFIGAAILHLCLMLVQGLAESRAGFEGTVRVISYAYIANLANIVPVVGGLIALVWSLILLVIGFSTMHRTTQGKAIAAVLVPVILCCVCILAFVFFGVGAAFLGSQGN